MNRFILLIGSFIGIIGITILDVFAWGLVLYKCYYWFVIPVFIQLPKISFYQAVGLMVFIGLFHTRKYLKYEIRGDEITTDIQWFNAIGSPWCFLLLAYLISIFL